MGLKMEDNHSSNSQISTMVISILQSRELLKLDNLIIKIVRIKETPSIDHEMLLLLKIGDSFIPDLIIFQLSLVGLN